MASCTATKFCRSSPVCVEQMISDLARFLEFYVIVFLAFAIALIGLGRVGLHTYNEDFMSYNGVFTPVGWSMFGWLEPDRFQSPLSIFVMFFYVMFVNITLVNLLIAMFSDTYQRVSKNAEREYTFKRFLSLHMYQNVLLAVPPPFNVPYVLWCILVNLLGCRRSESKRFAYGANASLGVGPQVEALARASLNRQITKDAASLGALADALPANIERVDERMEERMGALRMLIENRFADKEGKAASRPGTQRSHRPASVALQGSPCRRPSKASGASTGVAEKSGDAVSGQAISARCGGANSDGARSERPNGCTTEAIGAGAPTACEATSDQQTPNKESTALASRIAQRRLEKKNVRVVR